MKTKNKSANTKDQGKEKSNTANSQQNGNIGHPELNSQKGGIKIGANRDDDTHPTGEDEH